MTILQRMVVRLFVPVLLLAILFFVLILQLVDFFGNLWGYLANNASFGKIALVALYYLPKCISFALPIALLFAVSLTLGTLYTNNELISIFGSGVSLYRLVTPVIALGLLLSIGAFFFQEDVVIETFQKKNRLTDAMLQRETSYSNTNVTVLSQGDRIIYNAEFYNDATRTLSNVVVLERDAEGDFLERIDAQSATWKNRRWQLANARIYSWNQEHTFLVEEDRPDYTEPSLTESPETFRRSASNIDEMRIAQARNWINSLKRAGLPYRGDLTDYYNRFAFALTPFIVTFISSAIGGRFRKNILLMSLLTSLVVSVVYYVAQMMAILFAKLGYISPLTGAWGAAIVFLAAGLYLFRVART